MVLMVILGIVTILKMSSEDLGVADQVFLHQRHKGDFREGDSVAFTAVLRNGKLQAKDRNHSTVRVSLGLEVRI